MTDSLFKLGFIGGGLDSAIGQAHQIASQLDNRWKLVAGCFSNVVDYNMETADKWLVERRYDTWQELLEQERGRIDAVVVLTPTPTHTEIICSALDAGYAVISEKALAANSKDAQLIADTVDRNNGFLAVTYNYSAYPMVRELKAQIEAGLLGTIKQIHVEMPQEGFIKLIEADKRPAPQDWRLEDDTVPTLSLDLGVHVHNLIGFLTNADPKSVVAMSSTHGHFDSVIDNTLCLARYSDNIDCRIWFSKAALGKTNGLRLEVYGDKGSAEWTQLDPELLINRDVYGVTKILERSNPGLLVTNQDRYNRFKAGHPAGFIEAFANYYVDIADQLDAFKQQRSTKNPYVFGAKHALEGLLMLEAINNSSQKKLWVSIDN